MHDSPDRTAAQGASLHIFLAALALPVVRPYCRIRLYMTGQRQHSYCIRRHREREGPDGPTYEGCAALGKASLMALIYHIPHASAIVPPEWRKTIILSDRDLQFELLQMTDRYTDDIFSGTAFAEDTIVEFPISRLVVDPERFVDDQQEIMCRRGMGVVYLRRSDGTPLRADLGDKDQLVARYYEPHHRRLEEATFKHLQQYGRAIIIDCHSFQGHCLTSLFKILIDRKFASELTPAIHPNGSSRH